MTLSQEKAQQCIDALFAIGKLAARFDAIRSSWSAEKRNEAAWLIQEAIGIILSVEILDPSHFSVRASGILQDQKEKMLTQSPDQLPELFMKVQGTIQSIKHNMMEMGNYYNQ